MEMERIDQPDSYFKRIKQEAIPKRDFLAKQLIEVGLEPIIPDSGYFMLANITKLANRVSLGEDDSSLPENVRFVKYLVKKVLYLATSLRFSRSKLINSH